MLPGTKYTPDSILRILRKRWWIIAAPLVIGSVAVFLYGRSLPNLYRSETLLQLMPQRISEGYVRSAVNVSVEGRLATLKEQVLSRPHLEKMILSLDLYAAERSNGISMERLVERMRRDVTIKPEGPISVRVAYLSYSPEVAQQVTASLAQVFSEENLRDRENVAEATNSFLDSELAEAKKRLLEQEKKQEEYRKRFGSELPTQVGANLQALQGADNRLRGLIDATDRDRSSKLLLEREIAALQSTDPSFSPAGLDENANGAAKRLAAARGELTRLEMILKPDHPDVKTKKREIRDLEVAAAAETSTTPPDVTQKASLPTSSELARQRRVRDLTAQIGDIDKQLAAKEQQQQEVRAEIASYQSRLSALPTRESELIEITRDYQTQLEQYNRLAKSREESTLSANLERKNVGEQFRVLEPARTPGAPYSPDRLRLQMVGSVVGFMLGLGIVGFLEYRDSSFKTEEDVFRVLSVPVLAVIPIMPVAVTGAGAGAGDRKKARWTRWLATVSGAALVGIGVATWLWRQS